jgi:hypothetical protein
MPPAAVSPQRRVERQRLRRESNPLRAGLQPAALPVSYRSRCRARAEPTGLEPKATEGQPATPDRQSGALPIAPRLQTCADERGWHDERVTPHPGVAVSCENATRPPAIGVACASCCTHASIGYQRAWFSNADRPTRRDARRWGDRFSPRVWARTWAHGPGSAPPFCALYFLRSFESRPRHAASRSIS